MSVLTKLVCEYMELLEKEMATHSSVLPWEIPRTEEPGGLQSMGSQKSDMRATKQQQEVGTEERHMF